ncbi:response regulator transcription factor [Paenibacillus soyae]|uniref:Response regulator transcription factor n=1 Tax=Paenibacillus soyae TaxID=2969249 RepID=A0A9X2S9G4_9BACL|nr:response regulator transcription factor [Paenibacillus soyae]MCR2805101.1 response regulator transcription factor [Paenibacillus soyae]
MFRVLLVDDEAYSRQGLKELIGWERCGFQVTGETDNGEDALDMILQQAPDVVVTDIRMPVMDGIGLIQRAVQEHKLNTKFIIVSGYGEFKYAQQAVKYGVCDFLLKPLDEVSMESTLLELKAKLEREAADAMRQRNLMSNDILGALIKGEFTEREAEEWQAVLGFPPKVRLHYLFIELNEPEIRFTERRPETAIDVRSWLHETLEQIAPACPPLLTLQHRGRLGVIVGELPENWSVGRLARTLQSKLQQQSGCPVCIYIGEPVDRLADLKQAYATAKDAMNYKFMDDSRHVFDFAELRGIQPNGIIMDNSWFANLTESMEENDEQAITQSVEQLFRQFRSGYYAPEAVRTSLHRCVSEALAMLHRMKVDTEAMTYKEPMLSWHDRNVTGPLLKELFGRFIQECSRLAAEQRKDFAKGGIQKMKSYIDAHYASNISLKSIAAKFYMNPVYLGQLFKKTYGTYFNDYVLHLRVNEAKRLLRLTDNRVYEIADKVGFNNVEYFVSQFEKLERMTPTEYRNSLS